MPGDDGGDGRKIQPRGDGDVRPTLISPRPRRFPVVEAGSERTSESRRRSAASELALPLKP